MTELGAFLDQVEQHPKFIRATAMDPSARDKLAIMRHSFDRLYSCTDDPTAIDLLDELLAIVRGKGSLRQRCRALDRFIEQDLHRYPV
jgi:hypothetical protein